MRPSTIIPVLIWLAIIAIIAYIVAVYRPSNAELLVYALIVTTPAGLVYVLLSMRLQGRRRQLLAHRLNELGFTPRPWDEVQALHYIPERDHHSFDLHFAFTASWNGREIQLAEYDYDIGRFTFTMTEVAAEVPRGTPSFELRPHFTDRSFRLAFRPRSIINDKRFARRWDLRTEDPEAARDLLTPDLIDWLAKAPRRERAWKCDGRWLSCTTRRACYPRDIEPILGRLAAAVNKLTAGSTAQMP